MSVNKQEIFLISVLCLLYPLAVSPKTQDKLVENGVDIIVLPDVSTTVFYI